MTNSPYQTWVSDGSGNLRRPGLPNRVTSMYWDWSVNNRPWAYVSPNDWVSRIPASMNSVVRVDLSSTGSTFRQKLLNTLAPYSGQRVLINLPAGRYDFTSFVKVGTGGETYAFGFWSNPSSGGSLAGFIGEGPDKTFVEMAPNSVSDVQLTEMQAMLMSNFIPLQMAVLRIDTSVSGVPYPIFIGGVCFRAAWQNELTSVGADVSAIPPQPAPHQGLFISGVASHSDSIITHCFFEGFGRAMTSAPPFEMANVTSQKNKITYRNCEFDGRISTIFDASNKKKCAVWMGNGEVLSDIYDSWMHHSNVSRYAANDESVISETALSNNYRVTRTKIEQITTNKNYDQGGYTNACLMGWESSNALIELTDCILSVDNPYVEATKSSSQHLQFTTTGASRVGGRLKLIGGQFRNTGFPDLNGYLTTRVISSSPWYTSGVATTIDVRETAESNPKTGWVFSGTWPPTLAQIAAAGISPDTHYIIRTS